MTLHAWGADWSRRNHQGELTSSWKAYPKGQASMGLYDPYFLDWPIGFACRSLVLLTWLTTQRSMGPTRSHAAKTGAPFLSWGCYRKSNMQTTNGMADAARNTSKVLWVIFLVMQLRKSITITGIFLFAAPLAATCGKVKIGEDRVEHIFAELFLLQRM